MFLLMCKASRADRAEYQQQHVGLFLQTLIFIEFVYLSICRASGVDSAEC